MSVTSAVLRQRLVESLVRSACDVQRVDLMTDDGLVLMRHDRSDSIRFVLRSRPEFFSGFIPAEFFLATQGPERDRGILDVVHGAAARLRGASLRQLLENQDRWPIEFEQTDETMSACERLSLELMKMFEVYERRQKRLW